jgi:hypothetical protein
MKVQHQALVWKENKEYVTADYMALLPTDCTNANGRSLVFKQMIFALFGRSGTGQQRELPDCMLDGIREEWTEHSGEYKGFQKAPKRQKPSSSL